MIDKSKEEFAETNQKTNKVTQDQERSVENVGLSLSEEDAKSPNIWMLEYFLGLPYNENLLVRIKLN